MTKDEFYKFLSEAYSARKWPAHLTYEQIVAQWVHEKGLRKC